MKRSGSVLKDVSKLLLGAAIINLSPLPIISTEARAEIRVATFNANVASSLPSYRYDDYDYEKYYRVWEQNNEQYQRAERRHKDADAALKEAQKNERDLFRELEVQTRNLEQSRKKVNDSTAQLAAKQGLLINAQNSLPGAEAEVSSLRTQVSSTEQVIADLNQRLAQAPTPEEQAPLNAQIATQTQILEQLRKQLNTKSAEVASIKGSIENLNKEVAAIQAQINTARAEVQQTEAKVADMNRRAEGVRQTVRERKRIFDQAASELENQERALAHARRNVDNVRANIDRAGQILAADGDSHGRQDGLREGTELGSYYGQYQGQERGTIDGHREGVTSGQQRDYNEGYSRGRSQATNDAINKSNADAQAAADKDGKANGRKDGLQAAYDLGRREGLAHGEKTGDDKVAYAEGRKEGEASGLAQAVENAKPQFDVGYNDKENEYLNAPLKSVVVGDQAAAQKFKGLQGRYSNEGDDRYYRPQPGMVPHPRLEKFYMEAYDNAYRSTLSQSYASAYSSAYSSAYNAYYRTSYDSAYAQSYPESDKQGYNQAYNDTYKGVYNNNYRSRYDAVYRDVYAKTYDSFKLDQGQRDSGFKDGNRTASRAKGVREGFKDAYDNNIKLEEKKAYDDGAAKANELYKNNAIIKVSSVEVRDADGDGIFRPGENVVAMIKLKNFGLQAKTDLQSRILDASGVTSVSQPQVQAGVIPAQSDAMVIVPVQLGVHPNARDGEAFGFAIRAVTGDKAYFNQKFALTTQFPVEIQSVKFDGVLIPGVETPIRIQAYNRSKSVQNLNLVMTTDSSKVALAGTKFTIANLAPGQSQEVVVKATGLPEARFEEVPLNIFTTQNGLKFAMDKAESMTVIRRHSPTADSKGLIISGNLGLGAGKKIFSLDKFDTWDLRADGPVTMASLNGYRNRLLHILADEEGRMDTTSMLTLGQYVREGGSVVVWGPRPDRSSVGVDMLRILGIKVVSQQNLNGPVSGVQKLKGVAFNGRGSVSTLAANSLRAAPALNSHAGVIAMTSFQKGTAETVSQSLVAAIDLRDFDAQQFKSILATFELSRAPFATKLSNAMKSPAAAMHLVAIDMGDEIIEADSNVDFYRTNASKNKLMRSISKFLEEAGKKSSQAKEWAKYYPYLAGIIRSKQSPDQHRVNAILDTKVGGFLTKENMKGLFCDDNSKHSLCQ